MRLTYLCFFARRPTIEHECVCVGVQPCYKWWEVPYYWAGLKARAPACPPTAVSPRLAVSHLRNALACPVDRHGPSHMARDMFPARSVQNFNGCGWCPAPGLAGAGV